MTPGGYTGDPAQLCVGVLSMDQRWFDAEFAMTGAQVKALNALQWRLGEDNR